MPFPQWDGQHLCVDDWHVFLIGYFEGGDQSYTLKDAEEILALWHSTFSLVVDGESFVLDTVRTPVKPLLAWEAFDWDKVYAFQEGRIVSPDDLTVGEYTLAVVAEFDGAVQFESPIDFFVDPSDSAACTE